MGFVFWLAITVWILPVQSVSAQERLCDPSFEYCYGQIQEWVRNETVGIDMDFYMIELPNLVDDIIARHKAGVRVRIVVEPRANLKFPQNQPLIDKLNAAGVPLRYKLGDGIIHVKYALFAAQNKVLFTGSNFGDADVAPYVPYDNYVDGAWYFTDDPAVVNSLRRDSTTFGRTRSFTETTRTSPGRSRAGIRRFRSIRP